MIASLRLKNFKPFPDQSLVFKPLTLLSGLNSTGKSSVLQALLLLRQSYQKGLLPNKGLALNGDLVSIGTAKVQIILHDYLPLFSVKSKTVIITEGNPNPI
jgi:AAA15 family ATPase/GTPase